MMTGLMVRFGRFVPEHEDQADAFLRENGQFWQEKLARGVITSYEPYFFQTGDQQQERGFLIAKGPSDKLLALLQEEEYLMLVEKASALVDHVKVDLLTVGDDVGLQLERWRRSARDWRLSGPRERRPGDPRSPDRYASNRNPDTWGRDIHGRAVRSGGDRCRAGR